MRGEVILAANVIRPDSKNRNRTHFTMLTQAREAPVQHPLCIVQRGKKAPGIDHDVFKQNVDATASRCAAVFRSLLSNHLCCLCVPALWHFGGKPILSIYVLYYPSIHSATVYDMTGSLSPAKSGAHDSHSTSLCSPVSVRCHFVPP